MAYERIAIRLAAATPQMHRVRWQAVGIRQWRVAMFGLSRQESEGEMTEYSWLPYWLFGVVCIAFGFWLRGLFVNAPYDPNEPSSGAVYDAMPDPLDDYDVMRAKWLSLRFHRDTLEAQNSLRVTDEAL